MGFRRGEVQQQEFYRGRLGSVQDRHRSSQGCREEQEGVHASGGHQPDAETLTGYQKLPKSYQIKMPSNPYISYISFKKLPSYQVTKEIYISFSPSLLFSILCPLTHVPFVDKSHILMISLL